ncbi:hypothetical protein JB92DRAFT_1438434 [Gautieria morchelliformis]|nr:hypothetical protein JB92DRAFT_1438434 [Gautieria morchelliformis]
MWVAVDASPFTMDVDMPSSSGVGPAPLSLPAVSHSQLTTHGISGSATYPLSKTRPAIRSWRALRSFSRPSQRTWSYRLQTTTRRARSFTSNRSTRCATSNSLPSTWTTLTCSSAMKSSHAPSPISITVFSRTSVARYSTW